MKLLPEEITKESFVIKQGEYAWRHQHIVNALKAITNMELAILSGKIWIIEDGKIQSLFPSVVDIPLWNTYPQKPDELWLDYCKRTFDESIKKIEETQLEYTAPR